MKLFYHIRARRGAIAAGFGVKTPFARSAKKLFKCRLGVAATEFAIALPFLLALMLGGFELTRYVILEEKLEKVSYTIADVVTQSDSVTIAQIDQAMLAAATIMQPNAYAPHGVIIVSSVYKSTGASATVRWQHSGGGDLVRPSAIGPVGAVASLPNGLTLNDKDNVIITEVFYNYEPIFSGGLFPNSRDIYKVTLFKPRLGSLTTPPV